MCWPVNMNNLKNNGTVIKSSITYVKISYVGAKCMNFSQERTMVRMEHTGFLPISSLIAHAEPVRVGGSSEPSRLDVGSE